MSFGGFKNEVQVGDEDHFSPIWCEIMLISGGVVSIWRCFCCFVPDLKALLTGGVSFIFDISMYNESFNPLDCFQDLAHRRVWYFMIFLRDRIRPEHCKVDIWMIYDMCYMVLILFIYTQLRHIRSFTQHHPSHIVSYFGQPQDSWSFQVLMR